MISELAVLTGGPYAAAVHPDPDHAAACCHAFNEWTLAQWVAKDKRIRASIHIAPQDPQLAAAEIDRMAENPAFAGVDASRARMPFGNRFLPTPSTKPALAMACQSAFTLVPKV